MTNKNQEVFPFNLLTTVVRSYRGEPAACTRCEKRQATYRLENCLPPLQEGAVYFVDEEWRKATQGQMKGEYFCYPESYCLLCMIESTSILLSGGTAQDRESVTKLWQVARAKGDAIAFCATVHSFDDDGDTFATTCPDKTLEEIGAFIQQGFLP